MDRHGPTTRRTRIAPDPAWKKEWDQFLSPEEIASQYQAALTAQPQA